MRIRQNLKIRKIAGESVVIMQSSDVSDMTKVLSLNPTSEYLWENLMGRDFEEEDVIELLLKKYEVSGEVAKADAVKWCKTLTDSGVLC